MRCFRSCFNDDERRFRDDDKGESSSSSNRCQSGSFPPAFDFLSSLLRYFLYVSNNGKPFLTCEMVDATLATIVSPIVTEPVLVRRLAPSQLTPESVSYAALLMRGLEWVVIVNDICGSPFNPTDLLPSLFFDGKIFQEKFLKAKSGFSLLEICDGQSEQASLVHQMRAFLITGSTYSFVAPSFSFAGFAEKMGSIEARPTSGNLKPSSMDVVSTRTEDQKSTNASRHAASVNATKAKSNSLFRGSGATSFAQAKDYMQSESVKFYRGDGQLASAQRWNERGWGKSPSGTGKVQRRGATKACVERAPRGVVNGASVSSWEPKIALGRGTFLKMTESLERCVRRNDGDADESDAGEIVDDDCEHYDCEDDARPEMHEKGDAFFGGIDDGNFEADDNLVSSIDRLSFTESQRAI